MEPSITVTNEETGERFRITLLRDGSLYGRSVVWYHKDPGLSIEHLDPDTGLSRLSGQYYLKTLSEGPRRGVSLHAQLPSSWISSENHDEIVGWAEAECEKPWQAPPVVLPPSRSETQAMIDLAEAGSRRATVYSSEHFHGLFGIVPLECKWVAVFREQYAQYANGISVVLIPRNGRRHRVLELAPPHDLVVLLGWGHPDMVKPFEVVKPSEGGRLGYVQFTAFQGYKQQDEFEENFARYVAEPATHVLLDLRGERPVPRTSWTTDVGRTPILFPDGRVLRTGSVKSARDEIEVDAPAAPSVFVSYHHNGDARLRDSFERQLAGVIRSSSIFPGEIQAPASELVAKRVMRDRIGNCDALVVLVGQQTFGRRWVDWEIRAALDPRIRGGRKPLIGALSPQLTRHLNAIEQEISTIKGRRSGRSILVAADALNETFRKRLNMQLPPRLLDNVISGYASLHAWPRSAAIVESILHPRIGENALATNQRQSMSIDMPLQS